MYGNSHVAVDGRNPAWPLVYYTAIFGATSHAGSIPGTRSMAFRKGKLLHSVAAGPSSLEEEGSQTMGITIATHDAYLHRTSVNAYSCSQPLAPPTRHQQSLNGHNKSLRTSGRARTGTLGGPSSLLDLRKSQGAS